MFLDLYGLHLTTHDELAASAYNDAMALLSSDRPGAEQRLAQAIEADPRFALALAALSRLQRLKGRTNEASGLAIRSIEAAAYATAREASHVKALYVLAVGTVGEAMLALRAHLQAWPMDFFILSSFIQHAFFFGGRGKQTLVLGQLEKSRIDYGDDPRFLARFAFHLQEAGRFDQGLEMAERCLALDRDNGFAAHAKAHVLFARGLWAEAASFVDSWSAGVQQDGQLFAHMAWHRDLALVELGRLGEALAHFARLKKRPYPGPAFLALADDVGFLWRVRLTGVDTPPSWVGKTRELADSLPPSSAFNAVNIGFLHAYDGSPEPISALRERASKMPVSQGGGPDGVVEKALKGLESIARGSWEEGAAALASIAHDTVAIGGSNLERSLIAELAWAKPIARAA